MRDTYIIDLDVLKNTPDSGIDEVGVVSVPAIELEGITLSKNITKLSKDELVLSKMHFNSEKKQIAGYFSLSDFPIYRVDEDGYEYDLLFTKESTNMMHQKMMKSKIQDGFKINFEHRNEDSLKEHKEELERLGYSNGDVPANIYSIDYIDSKEKKDFIKLQYGIEIPSKYIESQGSFMVIQITDSDYFNFLKKNNIKSFSLEGYFKKIPINLSKKINEKMKKQLFRKPSIKGSKMLFSFELTTDKFESKEEILVSFPIGSSYADIIGEESYKDFTGSEEWTNTDDGTVFDVIVENGLIVDVVIKEESPEVEEELSEVEESPEVEEELSEVEEKPEEEKETLSEEITSLISSKFEEEVQPKIDELIEMVTKLRVALEEDKIKDGEDQMSNIKNSKTEKNEAFKSVIKNHFL